MIGVCGLYCERCPILKPCGGCEPNDACKMPQCASARGVELCFNCPDFPCELHYGKGNKPIYTKDFSDFVAARDKDEERRITKKVGVCGIYCGRCPALKRPCKGCPTVGCKIASCAHEKGYELCFDCPDFPCGLYDDASVSPFQRSWVEWVRGMRSR